MKDIYGERETGSYCDESRAISVKAVARQGNRKAEHLTRSPRPPPASIAGPGQMPG